MKILASYYDVSSMTLKEQKYMSHPVIRLTDLFVCVEVLRPSQPNGVMPSAVSLPNHTFTGQA